MMTRVGCEPDCSDRQIQRGRIWVFLELEVKEEAEGTRIFTDRDAGLVVVLCGSQV
jgi:hypothetical protein